MTQDDFFSLFPPDSHGRSGVFLIPNSLAEAKHMLSILSGMGFDLPLGMDGDRIMNLRSDAAYQGRYASRDMGFIVTNGGHKLLSTSIHDYSRDRMVSYEALLATIEACDTDRMCCEIDVTSLIHLL